MPRQEHSTEGDLTPLRSPKLGPPGKWGPDPNLTPKHLPGGHPVDSGACALLLSAEDHTRQHQIERCFISSAEYAALPVFS
jgi:hypothetical protein